MSRDNLHISRRGNAGRRSRRLDDESDLPECNSNAYRGASCCSYLALFVSTTKSPSYFFSFLT